MAVPMYLIDTNIISELTKGNKANRGIIEFFTTLKPTTKIATYQ